MDVVRKSRDTFLNNGSIENVIDLPKANSFDCEFILICHLPDPLLIKISQGRFSSGGRRYWIGTPGPIRRLAELEESLPIPVGYAPNNVTSFEEDAFRQAMHHILLEPVEHVKNGVGGFLIELLGSPYGHCYGGRSTMKWFDTVHFPPGLTVQQQADRASGMTMFGYSTLSSERGAPILGIFMEQIGLGYIYRPIEGDEPEKIYPCTLPQLHELVSIIGRNGIKRRKFHLWVEADRPSAGKNDGARRAD